MRKLLFVLTLFSPISGYAAGMMTHAYSAERGVEYLPQGALRALLEANIELVNGGAAFPDGGYFSGSANPLHREAAEHAHWGDWINDYVEYVRDEHQAPLSTDTGCDAVAAEQQFAIDGTFGWDQNCSDLVAYMMGNAAHGIGDEAWDRLFEDVIRFRGEELPPDGNPINTIEYLMDSVMIMEHNRSDDVITASAPVALVNVYKKREQFASLTEADVTAMGVGTQTLTTAEVQGAPVDSNRARLQMPWSSKNYFTHAGGVIDLSQMIARMYEHMWQKLKDPAGTATPPKVVGTWPEHNQTEVPWDMVDLRNTGARDAHLFGRIYAFLGNYANADSILVDGSICLFEEDGTEVAGLAYTGPFQDHANSRPAPAHMMWFKPDENLKPNTNYYVVVSQEVKDNQRTDNGGENLIRSNVWSFVTTASTDTNPDTYTFTKP